MLHRSMTRGAGFFSRIILVLSLATSLNGCTGEIGDRDGLWIPIHAIRTAENDGTRAATIEPTEISRWVDDLNRSLRDSAVPVAFTFDPTKDLEDRRDTLLNNVFSGAKELEAAGMCESEALCEELDRAQTAHANEVGSRYNGKVVVYFRHGIVLDAAGKFQPGWVDGGGASWIDLNFIMMPGDYFSTWVRTDRDPDTRNWGRKFSPEKNVDSKGWTWLQNHGLLAHEMGHYLGLWHTFPDAFKTLTAATSFVATHPTMAGRAEAFDGDLVSDTPPDACAAIYVEKGWNVCGDAPPSFVILGLAGMDPFSIVLSPDRRNLMSYFMCDSMKFSPNQVEKMIRSLKADPHRRHLVSDPLALQGLLEVEETETQAQALSVSQQRPVESCFGERPSL